jgi:hypothetical protein
MKVLVVKFGGFWLFCCGGQGHSRSSQAGSGEVSWIQGEPRAPEWWSESSGKGLES